MSNKRHLVVFLGIFYSGIAAPPPTPAAEIAATEESSGTASDAQNTTAEASTDEVEPPTSTEQGATAIGQSFAPLTHVEWVREARRQAFQDTKFFGELRSFYMDSDNINGSVNQAWALGGSLGFKTGYFRNLFAFGATGYTSQPLYAPAGEGGTLLLTQNQQGYTVLGQAYIDILLSERITASAGLKEYNTPFLSGFDSRMTPNTYEAVAVQGAVGGNDGAPEWRFGAGYADKIKLRDSDEFESMATAAGAPAGVSRGVAVAGAVYTHGDLYLGAVEYYSSDIINIAYFEAKDAFVLSERLRLQVAAQYTDQHSVGEDLLKGHPFSADQLGLKAELAFAGALLTGAYTRTGTGATIQSPWSLNPGYTTVQVENFDRAGEDAWMLRAAYNFRVVKNLSAYALYVHGSQPAAANQYAQDEYDLNLQWKAASGKAQGLTLLARYGYVTQAGPGAPIAHQIRLILYYTPPWLSHAS
jgi:outer membrane porin, OprD family